MGELQACKLAYLKPRREEPQQPKAGMYSVHGTVLSPSSQGRGPAEPGGYKGEARAASMERGLDMNNTTFFLLNNQRGT